MGRRLLRTTVKLGIIAGVIGALVIVGKKLMGGLGPEPGSAAAPIERPSLVDTVRSSPSDSGANGSTASSNGDHAASAPDEVEPSDAEG